MPAPDLTILPAANAPPVEANTSVSETIKDVKALVAYWSQPEPAIQMVKLASAKPPSHDHLEFAADGSLLYLVSYQQARHLLFRLSDGKKVFDSVYGTPPLRAASITADGKHLVAPLSGDRIGVFDIAQQKEVFLHQGLKDVEQIITSPGTTPKIFCGHQDGHVTIRHLLADQGSTFQAPKDGAPQTNHGFPNQKLALAASANGSMVFCNDPKSPGVLSWMHAEDDSFESFSEKVDTSFGGPVAAGTNIYVDTVTPPKLRLSWRTPNRDQKARAFSIFTAFAFSRSLSVSPDDRFAALIRPDFQSLDIYSCLSGFKKGCATPQGETPHLASFHWPTRRLACSTMGGLFIYRLDNIHCRQDEIMEEVIRCLKSKDDQRLLAIDAELANDFANFPFAPIDRTKREVFMSILGSGPVLVEDPDAATGYQEFIARNADTELGKLCRIEEMIRAGTRVRGTGYANTVSPERMNAYEQKMAEAFGLLKEFLNDEKISGHTYSLLFALARGPEFTPERMEPFVSRMFKEAPLDLSAHATRAEALMPRWGGEPDECEAYAARVADFIGGPDGDAAYATIVTRMLSIGDHGIMDQLGFDPDRFQRGIDHRFRDDLDSVHYRQLAFMLAYTAGDKTRTQEFWKKIFDHRDVYAYRYANETIYKDMIRKAFLNK
jgi:hypothetical protein